MKALWRKREKKKEVSRPEGGVGVVFLYNSVVKLKQRIVKHRIMSTSRSHPAENILQRVLNTLKFSWLFLQSLLDDLTDSLNDFCKDSLDISKVLRLERALLNQQQKKVR